MSPAGRPSLSMSTSAPLEVPAMTRDHADFYLGTGPDARWLGSLAEIGGPDQVSRLDARAGHCLTTGVLSALDPDTYETAVAALLDHRDTEAGFVAVPEPRRGSGLAVAGGYQYSVVCVRLHRPRCARLAARRPLVHPRPRSPRLRRHDRDRPGRRAA